MPRESRTTAEDACLAFEKVTERLYAEAKHRWRAQLAGEGGQWLPILVDVQVMNAGPDSNYAVEVSLVIEKRHVDSVVGKGDTLYLATRDAFRALRDPSTLPR